jgi:queuosine precursor transporter
MSSAHETRRVYHYFDLVMAAFVAVLMISNIASTKTVDLGPFKFDGGTILFPLAYIFGDVLTEVYGYRRSRRVIWAGFFWIGAMAGVLALVDALPAAQDYPFQESFHNILGQTPRIVIASLLGYWAGEFSNSVILAKIKILTQGRWLWMRTIGSTILGEGVDTLLFVFVAFYGVLPGSLVVAMMISNYVFKCGFEALATPLTYRVVAFLKRAEREDYYDYGTDFNPFGLEV